MPLVGSVYPPEVWAQESLMVLRDTLVMARLVHRDFENVVAQQGDTVNTRKPAKGTARTWAGQAAFTDASEQIHVENLHANNLAIVLDTIQYTAFLVQDKDAVTSMKNLREEFIIPYVDPIAQAVDDDIMTEMTAAASAGVGGAALTAYAHDTVGLGADMNEDDIIKAREQLFTNQCPMDRSLSLVLSAQHEADCLALALFHQADQSGSTEALTNANLGRKFGFGIYATQNVPTALDTDATPQSLAFHRNVCALVTRPLGAMDEYGAKFGVQAMDGIGIRVASDYSILHKGVIVSFDVLYGVQLLDSHLGVIVNP